MNKDDNVEIAFSADGNKILIIDDDEIIRMQVETILKKNGYKPVSAPNGEAGLASALSERPALILLDRQMPGMDGNETLLQLKNNEKTRTIPVIMLTGDNRVTDVSTSFELGACDYILKPFEALNVVMRIKRALGTPARK